MAEEQNESAAWPVGKILIDNVATYILLTYYLS